MDKNTNKQEWSSHIYVAGVDEVGRGPLAGPVVAGAVILPLEHDIVGLRDSKRLSASKREQFAKIIQQKALAWSVGRAEVEEIDRLNILKASLLAMKRALDSLTLQPNEVLVDGLHIPECNCFARAITGGDDLIPAISAASIIAKVSRDAEMCIMDEQYPGYGFAKHKGYPTALHIAALKQLGVCDIHRRSFKPVAQFLKDNLKEEI